MWQSIKTVSRDARKVQENLGQSMEDCQRRNDASLEQILFEIRKMHADTEKGIRELSVQMDFLKHKAEDLEQKIDKLQSDAEMRTSGIQEEVRTCTEKLAKTKQSIKEFAEDVKTNLALVDEGTRLVIANMMLDEMGDN